MFSGLDFMGSLSSGGAPLYFLPSAGVGSDLASW